MDTRASNINQLKTELREIQGYLQAASSVGYLMGDTSYLELNKKFRTSVGILKKNGKSEFAIKRVKLEIEGQVFGFYETYHALNLTKAAITLRRQGMTPRKLEKKLHKLGQSFELE